MHAMSRNAGGETGRPLAIPVDRWSATEASALDEVGLLVYRSRLLGADLAVTNFGGGNTSAKLRMPDPLSGEPVDVLWVKGSGGDLGSIAIDGFSTLYLDKLRHLESRYRGRAHEDEMVGLLAHCTFNLNPRAPSIDTPLHAFLPFTHVDHVHPDAVIALAAAADGERWTREIYGDGVAWVPWQRPGFDLALALRTAAARPGLRGLVLAGHGLFAWAATAEGCYRNTIELIAIAALALNSRIEAGPAFGGAHGRALDSTAAEAALSRLLPRLRAATSGLLPKVAHVVTAPEVLEFVSARNCDRLAKIGTSCPDHFLRTKIWPLVLEHDATDEMIDAEVERYRREYAEYYHRCRGPGAPEMRDPNPVIVLVRDVGLVSLARDRATARIASEFYVNAINVMRGAEALGGYVGLPEREAFDIEYWALEEAKLKRLPAAPPLTGRVALVTGGAGGIGRAVAERLLGAGACVVLVDIDDTALSEAGATLGRGRPVGTIESVRADVTSEADVRAAVRRGVLAFGGVDILVANAGIASAASIEETTLDAWRQNFSVLTEGYFLFAREVFPLMKARGGAIVFVASKNALVASPNAAAYSSAKAAELHLARCLALEGAPHGIRVNAVNPDAVLRGSRIWDGKWRQARATAYGLSDDQLEEHYRQRSLLKRSVYAEDVAEAVYFFASDLSAKSTGNIINVDGGNAAAFVR